MAEWEKQGLVYEWYRSVPALPEDAIRWRGAPSMTAMAKELTSHVSLQLNNQALSVHAEEQGW